MTGQLTKLKDVPVDSIEVNSKEVIVKWFVLIELAFTIVG